VRHRLRRSCAVAAAVAFVCALASSGMARAVEPSVTLGAAGNIACGAVQVPSASECQQGATASLVSTLDPDAVATLGDQQYDRGTAGEYSQFYANTWGALTVPVHPVPGNHEYMDPAGNAAGYFGYFGPAAGDPTTGYYSYDLGSWHIIALNSTCNVIHNCAPGSAQEQWLRADLAAHPGVCTLAYWHHPLFTSGETGGDPNNAATRSFWQALYEHGADVVLNGHDHSYQRFALQTPNGASDPAHGIREFIVGTGGRSLFTGTVPAANLQVRDTSNFGVLLLTLDSDRYSWQFFPSGGFTDSGSASCHEPTPPSPPSPPPSPPPSSPPPSSPPPRVTPPPSGAPSSAATSPAPTSHSAIVRLHTHWLTIDMKTGRGAARARCDNAPADKCVVALTLSIRGTKIGTASGTIAGGNFGLLRVKLNHKGRVMLRRSRTHRLRVNAVGASKNEAGQATAIDRTLRLKGTARKHR
jgi:Calcineurin-like phosphoesterase